MSRRNAQWVLVGVIALAFAGRGAALAHQTPGATVPVEAIGQAPPPLDGSKGFLSEGLPRLRPRCDADQSETLDRVDRLLIDAEIIRWGGVPGVDARAAENLRAEAEQKLLSLLDSFEDTIEIDLSDPDQSVLTRGVDPQHSSLLLRIVDGDGPRRLRLIDWDLTGEAFDRITAIELGGSGITHALVRLRNLPEDPTIIRFGVHRLGGATPAAQKAVEIDTPPMGRLVVSLRDGQGRPTHALFAIRSTRGGAYYEPPGAVNLRPQLNDIVSEFIDEPDRGYTFFLPGAKRGRYWICPPEIDATLPVGEWELLALRGPEQTPEVRRIRVEPGRIERSVLRVSDWINMSRRGWWSGDDHVHARLMSGADGQRLLDYSEAVDLHVSNILEMGDPLRTYYAQRGYGRDYRVSRGNRWLVPGQEDPRSDLGHAIGLNLDKQVRDMRRYLSNDWLAAEIHRGGGLYGHTHVGANACFVHREMALFTPAGIVDFNSIMQAALGVELYYDFLNLGFKMTASAGSDTPYGGTVGTVRVYVKTGQNQLSGPDDWFDALAAGRTFVTNGPMLELSVDGAGPGATVVSSDGGSVRVVAKAEGDPQWSAPRSLRIVRLGKAANAIASDDVNRGSLSIDCEVPVGDGCWIAAHAIGHDGSEALTTPVYVPGADGWHGDRQQAPRLAKKQLAVLDEIEEFFTAVERNAARGVHPMDLATPMNASQADAVRKQIAKSRSFYEKLIARSESVQAE